VLRRLCLLLRRVDAALCLLAQTAIRARGSWPLWSGRRGQQIRDGEALSRSLPFGLGICAFARLAAVPVALLPHLCGASAQRKRRRRLDERTKCVER
jgi:hypothetical protein